MSYPAASPKPDFSLPPARLIPGALEHEGVAPRRKAASATAPTRYWKRPSPASEKTATLGKCFGQKSPPQRNVLIIGAGETGLFLAETLGRDKSGKSSVVGFLDDHRPVGGEVLGRTSDFATIVRREFVDEIILTASASREATVRLVCEARSNRVDVRLAPDLFGSEAAAVAFTRCGGTVLLTLSEETVPVVRLRVKRAIDLLFSALGLLLTFPLFIVISCAIWLDSPGPIFYFAPRLGLKGRLFPCLKFRTMVPNANTLKQRLRAFNQRGGPFFKIADDPRLTGVGRWLRRYSLDELPQLWNVLRGEMSLVGPRPHPIDDFDRYDLEDWQRLDVVPGLTGLWQVTARDDPSFARNMALDREYIVRWTLRLDLQILLKTIAVVLRGEGV